MTQRSTYLTYNLIFTPYICIDKIFFYVARSLSVILVRRHTRAALQSCSGKVSLGFDVQAARATTPTPHDAFICGVSSQLVFWRCFYLADVQEKYVQQLDKKKKILWKEQCC